MSRIFITGDVHNTIDVGKFNNRNFPIQKELTWFDNKNFTTLFIDGNHGATRC